jgi:predicted Zn-dependent protease
VKPLSLEDTRFLDAATGWLELGNWREANEELESITASMRAHPEVLSVRSDVYAAAGNWPLAIEVARCLSEVLPENPIGFLNHAFGLHELKRTREASEILLPIAGRFPKDHLIRYNLACYTCQLGNLPDAFAWLEQAIALAGKNEIRIMALDDPDLEPLWKQLETI